MADDRLRKMLEDVRVIVAAHQTRQRRELAERIALYMLFVPHTAIRLSADMTEVSVDANAILRARIAGRWRFNR